MEPSDDDFGLDHMRKYHDGMITPVLPWVNRLPPATGRPRLRAPLSIEASGRRVLLGRRVIGRVPIPPHRSVS
jgi:hypothetical protein